MADFACKECHMILEESSCPRCPEAEISREWQGFVEILIFFKLFVFNIVIEFLVLNTFAPIFFKISISYLKIFGSICLIIIFFPIKTPAIK